MTSTRRIALVIGQLTRGGAEGQLLQVVRGLDRNRFEPVVYCLSAQTEPIGSAIAACGVPVHRITGSGPVRALALARRVRAGGAALVHSWLYLANAVAGAAHVLTPACPLITSARNCKVQGWMSRAANVLAFRTSRAIVANSDDVAAYIAQTYWAPRQRIRVVPNGIDTERFHPDPGATARLGPIVTVGRLVEQKDHQLFLHAAAVLVRKVPDAQFVIVGDGPLRPRLEESARSLGLANRVAFAGERGDVETILRTASMFWLTSRWEGMPNVILEALASGLPVIATDVGGTRALVRSGIEGSIVSPPDAVTFAEQAWRILGHAETRRRVAAAARARAEEFSTVQMVRRMSQVYDEVLGGRHAA